MEDLHVILHKYRGVEGLAGKLGHDRSPVVRRAALVLAFVMLSACSDVSIPKVEMPSTGPDPVYSKRIADYFKKRMEGSESY